MRGRPPARRGDVYVLLGDVGYQFPTNRDPECPALLARLDAVAVDPRNISIQLCHDELVTSWALRIDRHGLREIEMEAKTRLWDQATASRDAEMLLSTEHAPSLRYTPAPVALLVVEAGSTSRRVASYGCTRVRRAGTSWVKLSEAEVDDVLPATLFEVARAHVDSFGRELASELHQFRNFEPETEIESKLTLDGHASPWAIASFFARLVEAGALEGFVSDLGNEIQRWAYDQDTFEILDPVDERGYLGFAQQPDQTYVIKHKTFETDMLRRQERFRFDVRTTPDTLEECVAAEFPALKVRRLPRFSRSRFDVNVESKRTGHFYGIETDEVVVGPHVLRQVEIEYHKSRRTPMVTAEGIEDELFRLQHLVRDGLTSLAINAEPGYLSKLTFLRGLVD